MAELCKADKADVVGSSDEVSTLADDSTFETACFDRLEAIRRCQYFPARSILDILANYGVDAVVDCATLY